MFQGGDEDSKSLWVSSILTAYAIFKRKIMIYHPRLRELVVELSEVGDDMGKTIKNKTHELFFTKLIIPIVIFVCFVIGIVLAVI